jgi:hypothetical protein
MKSDAVIRSDTARRQSARKPFRVACKPLVSPDPFVKDECRTFWPSLHLVR